MTNWSLADHPSVVVADVVLNKHHTSLSISNPPLQFNQLFHSLQLIADVTG
jgi:hypothetical protein